MILSKNIFNDILTKIDNNCQSKRYLFGTVYRRERE